MFKNIFKKNYRLSILNRQTIWNRSLKRCKPIKARTEPINKPPKRNRLEKISSDFTAQFNSNRTEPNRCRLQFGRGLISHVSSVRADRTVWNGGLAQIWLSFSFFFFFFFFSSLWAFLTVLLSLTPSEKSRREKEMATAEQLVLELIIPEQRENALLDLSKVSLYFFFVERERGRARTM